MNELIKNDNKVVNQTLNILKFFSALCVIAIHCTLDRTGKVGMVIDALIRFATPIFFLISGYYSVIQDNEQAKQKYKMRIIKLIKLIIISAIIYFVYYCFMGYIKDASKWIKDSFTIKKIYIYILFNISPFEFHLWFLNALLYCYIFSYLLRKYNIDMKKLYKYIPILLLCNIMLGEFAKYNNIVINTYLYRNFIFTGLPFYLIGYYIKDKMNNKWDKISNKSLIYAVLIGLLLTAIERLSVDKLDTYIGTIITSIGLFSLAVKNPNIWRLRLLEFIGGKLYTSIYIMHAMVLGIVNKCEKNIGITNEYKNYINILIVFVITAIIATIIHYIGVVFSKTKTMKKVLDAQQQVNKNV